MSDADILIVASLMLAAAGLGLYLWATPGALICAGVVGFLLAVFGLLAERRAEPEDGR